LVGWYGCLNFGDADVTVSEIKARIRIKVERWDDDSGITGLIRILLE
jgi:hypothetical protein